MQIFYQSIYGQFILNAANFSIFSIDLSIYKQISQFLQIPNKKQLINSYIIQQIIKKNKQIKQKKSNIYKNLQSLKLQKKPSLTKIINNPKQMSIIYSVITRINKDDHTILCSYDMAHGNYPSICQDILKNAKITQSKIYNYNGQYNFHILKDGDLLFVCMAASNFKNKVAFSFLQEIKKKFKQKYPIEDIKLAKAYDMSASFSEIYKNQINYYNSTQVQDNKDVLMRQLNTLQQVMSQNIEKVLQNQQKVQLIVKKTTKLHSIADQIKKNASKMKKDAFWKKNKCKLAVGGIIVAACASLIFII